MMYPRKSCSWIMSTSTNANNPMFWIHGHMTSVISKQQRICHEKDNKLKHNCATFYLERVRLAEWLACPFLTNATQVRISVREECVRLSPNRTGGIPSCTPVSRNVSVRSVNRSVCCPKHMLANLTDMVFGKLCKPHYLTIYSSISIVQLSYKILIIEDTIDRANTIWCFFMKYTLFVFIKSCDI